MSDVKFELRGLKADDMFPMFGILSKIGLKDIKESITPDGLKEAMSSFNNQEGDADNNTTYLGFSIMMDFLEIIMKNLPSCQKDIYSFLASLSGMTVQEIGNLDVGTFTEMIIAVIKKDEFKDFFKAVSGLFK
jgi:hypothetical protein